MKRFRRSVAHEWRMLHEGRLALWALAIAAALSAYAALNGARWADGVEARIGAARAEEARRLDGMRAEVAEIEAGLASPARFRDPTKASWVGEFLGARFAHWPPSPLAAWSIGQRDLLPASLKVSTLSRDAWFFEEEIENPLHLALGRFDLAFVVIVVLPLLVLALSFDLLSAEREAGTMPLLLAQPIRLSAVVAPKALVRIEWAAALVLVVLAAGMLFAPPGISVAMVWRVAAWALTALLYLAFWIGMAALVNLYGGGSAANAVRLTALWMLLVVIVPALISLTAAARHPPPSRIEVHERGRELRRELGPRVAAILEAYYSAHPTERPATHDQTDWAPGFYASQIVRDEALASLYDRHDAEASAQQAFVDRWRWLSPALTVQGVFHDLGGTGANDARRFLGQVLAFHEKWQAFFYPRLFARAPMTVSDYDRLPAFVFESTPASQVAATVLLRLAVLFVFGIAVIAACRWRLRRA